jgi:hypothetical protein
MVYDSQQMRILMFGGTSSNDTGGSLGDTWSWDGASWTLVATGGPSARELGAMAFDSARGRIVLFGGAGPSGSLGDTWEWDWNLSAWVLRATSGPGARHVMAFDSTRSVVVLFGGRDDSGALGDTWEWDGNTWTAQPGAGPSARGEGAMAAAGQGRVLLFGGDTATGLVGDTWEWSSLPIITAQPADAQGCRAGFVSFSVSAAAAFPLTYQWRKGATDLADGPSGTGSVISGALSENLQIHGCTAADAGSYSCAVTDSCGQTLSNPALLSFCSADFNCDGQVNSQDFFDFITAFFALVPAADFNGDGIVNSQDFFDFLTAFFAGC